MSQKIDWHGVFPAVPTHFHNDFSLNLEATQNHIEILLNNGIHGLIMLGTIGENCSLTREEKRQVLEAAVEVTKGKVPVLSGVAEYTTPFASETVKLARQAGVDGIMLLPALVYNADDRETITHFRTVAQSTDLPIMCYNNPPVYGIDITPENFRQLTDLENIVCIKEASGDVRRITDLFNALGDRFILFSGLDDVAFESVMLGCKGWVSGLVDSFPKENRMLWDAAISGDWERGLEIYRWYMPMLHFDSHPKLVQLIKLSVAAVGYGSELTRPPRLPLIGKEREDALKIIYNCIETRPT